MSRNGLIVARQHANDLPPFDSLAEAERTLLAQRDTALRDLLAQSDATLELDYSPQSLNTLERWYFENGQPVATTSGLSMPHAIAFYFGEVLCRNAQFQWTVQEFAFSLGRYEVGVQRQNLCVMLTKGKLPSVVASKRMRSLWRDFHRYAA